MFFRIALLSLCLASLAHGAEDCTGLHASFVLTKSKLSDLARLEAELEEKYHKYVTEDFVSQVEGSVGSLSHGSALKVAYARKHLKTAIAEKQASLQATRDAFCSKCSGFDRAAFCEACAESPACAAAP